MTVVVRHLGMTADEFLEHAAEYVSQANELRAGQFPAVRTGDLIELTRNGETTLCRVAGVQHEDGSHDWTLSLKPA